MNEQHRYCRACKSIIIENFIEMSSGYFGTSYGTLYHECTGIDTKKDEFSQILCQTCVRALVFAHEFTQMCKKTQKELEESILGVMKDENQSCLEEISKEDDLLTVNESPKTLEVTSEVWKCDLCEAAYLSLPRIKQHITEIHKEHKCRTCASFFLGSVSYNDHLNSCTKPTSFICTTCNKTFSSASVLNRHTRTVHANIRKFMCKICNKSFTLKTHLNAHQSVHTEARPYNCDICSLSFKTEAILKHHFHAHTAKPDHICDICGASFKSLYYLKTHQTIHTNTRDFTCDICNKSYKTIKTLRDHTRSHNDNERLNCHVCGKSFKHQITLTNHLKDHFTPGLKCSECGMTCKNKYVLRDHIASNHENVRNYVCQYEGCDYAYFTSSHLNYHVKAVHLGMEVRKSKR